MILASEEAWFVAVVEAHCTLKDQDSMQTTRFNIVWVLTREASMERDYNYSTPTFPEEQDLDSHFEHARGWVSNQKPVYLV